MRKNNDVQSILPGQTIAIIGGGQLGRMMALAARAMGYRIIVLDPTPDCPTAHVADEQIVAAYDDMTAIKDLTAKSDVVTYEFENVDLAAARYIEAAGKLPQGAFALETTQHREREKTVIKEAGLSVPDFVIVTDGASCEAALEDQALPAVIKTCQGGYDGKGQLKLTSAADFPDAIAFAEAHDTCIIEAWVPFDKEISVVFTRGQSGELTLFPLAENVHENHILAETTVPANVTSAVEAQAIEAATVLANKMNIVGTFTLEIFVQGNMIYINEMAPRPHNSGHYTIEACNISQFTQHIRAICGLPLCDVVLLQPAKMLNVLGKDLPGVLRAMQTCPDAFVHLYGKAEPQAERKMGHVTFIGASAAAVDQAVTDFKEEKR